MATEIAESSVEELRFSIRLVIKHPNLAPELISERLGMVPHMTQVAGAHRFAPNGTPLNGTYKDSRWGWSTRIVGKRNFFDDVSALARRLKPHKLFFSEIVESGGTVEIVVHLPGDVNIGWTLPWKDLGILAELKIDLGVEVFPHFK